MIKNSALEKYPHELESLDYICGIDEVGRGCLAGPVFAGAVILPKDFDSELIRDSKKLSEKKRLEAFELIKENALSWSYCHITQDIIDSENIQKATYSAMYHSIKNLDIKPQHLLVDGNVFENKTEIPHTCVIKGDNKYLCIAAASIVAKVIRDDYMVKLDKFYPKYNWKSNKGYGSKEHIEKILSEGITQHHRKSFLKKILS
jgi:ribonuclease HII